MSKKIILSVVASLFIPLLGNTTQEYISADSTDTQNANNTTQPVTTIAPQSDQIYVLPPQQQANNTPQPTSNPFASNPSSEPNNSAAEPQPNSAMENSDNYSASHQPQAQTTNNNINSINNFPQSPVTTNMNNTSQSQPQIENSLRQNVVNQISPQTLPQSNNGYTDQAKQGWLTSCTSVIKNPKVAAYAEEFCGCGWQHISSGELSAELLTSQKSADTKKRNSILKTISQQCLVEVMAKHNLR